MPSRYKASWTLPGKEEEGLLVTCNGNTATKKNGEEEGAARSEKKKLPRSWFAGASRLPRVRTRAHSSSDEPEPRKKQNSTTRYSRGWAETEQCWKNALQATARWLTERWWWSSTVSEERKQLTETKKKEWWSWCRTGKGKLHKWRLLTDQRKPRRRWWTSFLREGWARRGEGKMKISAQMRRRVWERIANLQRKKRRESVFWKWPT